MNEFRLPADPELYTIEVAPIEKGGPFFTQLFGEARVAERLIRRLA